MSASAAPRAARRRAGADFATLRAAWDAPTLIVAAAVYCGWAAATAWSDRVPAVLRPFVGGWLVAWHGSLQHETIHGRPTGSPSLNALAGVWPLALWLPYARYRDDHLAHHRTAHVTHPDHDPESRYLPPILADAGLARTGRAREAAAKLQATLAGRLLFGPTFEVVSFLLGEAARLRRGERDVWRAWGWHVLALAAVLAWLHACGLGLFSYVLNFVLPGGALTLLRSYAEHRADPDPRRRAAVVEAGPVFSLLFLNNNLHALHHARPDLAWWRLPAAYAQTREALLRANGGLVYRGYLDVAARFWHRPHDDVRHPGPVAKARSRP